MTSNHIVPLLAVILALVAPACSSQEPPIAGESVGVLHIDERGSRLVIQGVVGERLDNRIWSFAIEEVLFQIDSLTSDRGDIAEFTHREPGDVIVLRSPTVDLIDGGRYVVVCAQIGIGDPDAKETTVALFDAETMEQLDESLPRIADLVGPGGQTVAGELRSFLLSYIEEASSYNEERRRGGTPQPGPALQAAFDERSGERTADRP